MRTASRFPFLLAIVLLGYVCLGGSGARAIEKSSSYLAALESIQAGDLRRHVAYLADDRLKGREAGQRGGRAAGSYLANRLHGLGLRGGGIDGGFFQPFAPNFRNVLGRLSGSDSKLSSEFVIVCAHYDHVGYGTLRNSRGPVGYVHNGADDNASGVSVLIELAEAFAMLPEPPRRSVLFAAWDAEEKGLLGSKYWVARPTLPLNRVVAVLNMDMVGCLQNDRLTLLGSRSGVGLRRLVSLQNEGLGLLVDFDWSVKTGGDQYPFFQRSIPVLLLHTGEHERYHTPYDDAKWINHAGMNRVARLAFHVVYELADRPQGPRFRPAARRETEATRRSLAGRAARPPDRLGVGWRPDAAAMDGVRLNRVVYGSPADRAELRPGDRIVQFAGREIHCSADLSGALMAAESPATAIVRRTGHAEPLQRTVQLAGKPIRLGIFWRVDDAEPGTIILTHVVLGSPAARAGLRPGERIYQVAGRDFADETEFAQLARTLPEPLELLVERNGQVRTVVLHIEIRPSRAV